MTRTPTALSFAFLAAALPASAPGQTIVGQVTEGCVTAADMTGAALVALSSCDHDDTDVLFDSALAGGPGSSWYPYRWDVQLRLDGSYSVPPNFSHFHGPSTGVAVVVMTPDGRLAFDSDWPPAVNGYYETVTLQPACAYDGLAPLVEVEGDVHVVSWRPIREHAPQPIEPLLGDCARGGRLRHGAFVGYNLYALDATTRPVPTLRDFLTHGEVTRADVTRLDFEVPDPDGFSGSDLDPADGLRLVNPDGAPDTGDEVLSFEACPAGGAATWYRLQPLLRGDFEHFDGGPVGIGVLPSVLLDLDGDGSAEGADLLLDGYADFIDPLQCALGLALGNEIFSSPAPGLGVAIPGSSCAPRAVPVCGPWPPWTCDPGASPPAPPPAPQCAGTVVIGGCDSGVAAECPDGTCLHGVVAACQSGAGSHGELVSCLSHALNELKRDGQLSGRDKSRVLRCAQSSIPSAIRTSRSRSGARR